VTEFSLDRRTALKTTAATAAAAGAIALGSEPSDAAVSNRYFQHGVASGDPLPDRVILWTRLTPTREAEVGSSKGPQATVTWQIAKDRAFTKIVNHGRFVTSKARNHTVKVDAGKLRPGTTYYYRFLYKGVSSRIGRTRTAPAANSLPGRVRFGIVSCANLQAGWFSAYRHLAKRDDIQAVLHLGDYIYEYAPGQYGYGMDNVDIRKHNPAKEMVSLTDYRQRHAQYKRDPDLQDLHAKFPFICTWDDHEVTNDRWKKGAENHNAGEGDFLARQARAYRAYDEWMPIRLSNTASLGDGTRIFRRLKFGKLAELTMLDLRTYRNEAVKSTTPSPGPTVDPAVDDPNRTITGRAQMDYLKESLNNRRAQWKLIGNPVMIAPVNYTSVPTDLVGPIADITGMLPKDGAPINTDQWDGYTDDRREVLTHIKNRGVRDTVFLTGDIHSAWACDLPTDPSSYPAVDTSVAVEFVSTSVTSNNLKDITGSEPRTTSLSVEEAIKSTNRHVKYLNFDDHGFSILDITSARAQIDFFIIGDRKDKNAGVSWTTSYKTLAGTAKVEAVDKPVAH